MKTLLRRFTALCLLWFAAIAAGAAPRVLFVGNSYTRLNELPRMFRQMMASTGAEEPEVKASVPDGLTFEKQLKHPGTLKLIDEGNWDFVILQGQSQEASVSETAENVRSNFVHGASNLCQRVKARSPKAKIVFFQTWARHADYWKAPEARIDIGKDAADMLARNRKWYEHVAGLSPGSVVAPVGEAWELNYRNAGAIRLHQTDNSHPNRDGSYLASLVIYGTVSRPAKLAVPFRGDLPEARAGYLQGIAEQTLHTLRL